MGIESIISQAFNGLSIGSILLLAALGLAFSFGLMKVINMAHGEFIMIGAYTTFVCQKYVAVWLGGTDGPKNGIVFILSIAVAFVVTAAFGLILEQLVIRHLYGRPLDTLLATWGVGLMLQQGARSIFGAPNVPVTSPVWLSGALKLSVADFDFAFPYKRLFIIALVIVCIIGIYIYLYRTANGRRIRAVMQKRETASSLGVATRRVDAFTFALGAGLAGVAGSALTLVGQIGPSLGTGYIVDAFMVVILGGVGSLPGTILAAFSIGVFNAVFEMQTSATIAKVIVFALIILFLQWKPNGILSIQTRS